MTQQGDAREPYVIPRYREAAPPAWYHVLHGTVPGHQIDFIYSPEVPQGPLTQTHLAHLARIIKYIEPRDHTSLAFAIGNLSRDDVQHEPGHGGLGLIFGLRVQGVIDHASRDMPPYAHGLLAIDRALDYSILLDAISTFYRRFLQEGPSDATGDFYRSYVQVMRERPQAVDEFLRAYIREFADLPQPPRSTFGGDFLATEGAHPQRVTIVHAPNEPFTSIAHVAATLGSVLYRSNVRWTSISNGREIDIAGGVTVRLVPEGEVPRSAPGLVLRLDEVPTDDAEIAQHLFGAHPRETGTVRRVGWREQMAAKKGGGAAGGVAREAPSEGAGGGARDGGREAVRAREASNERAHEREALRERESAREREAARGHEPVRERESVHDLVRERDSARERAGAGESGDGVPGGVGGAHVAGLPGVGNTGVASAGVVTAPRVAATNPLSASAGAIAASLMQSVPAEEGAEGTTVMPPVVGLSASPVPEVDDAARTLTAPLRLDSELAADDASATLTAALLPSAVPSSPGVAGSSSGVSTNVEAASVAEQSAEVGGGVAAGVVPAGGVAVGVSVDATPAALGARATSGNRSRAAQPDVAVASPGAPLSTKVASAAVSATPDLEAGAELGSAGRGKGRWVAIGAAVVAAAVVLVIVVANSGSPEGASGQSSTTAPVPGAPSPGNSATLPGPSTSGTSSPAGSGSAGGATTGARDRPPANTGTGNSGAATGGAGSVASSSSGASAPGTFKAPSPVVGSAQAASQGSSSPSSTTPRPASTKTKTKTTKLDDTNLD